MTTALLVIDVQESFRQHPSWARVSNPEIASVVGALVDHARASDDEVIWVLHEAPGSGTVFDPAQGYVRLMSELDAAPGELVLHKTSHNAFTTTSLAQHLTTRGVRAVRIVGIRTEQCCETTARLASDLGYDVELVLDATATHPLPVPGGGELTTEQVMTQVAAALSGRFATIVSADQIVTGETTAMAG